MPKRFHFTTVQLIMLLLNLFVLGGCLVLIALTGLSWPLILLTIGTLGMAGAKLRKASGQAARQPDVDRPQRGEHSSVV